MRQLLFDSVPSPPAAGCLVRTRGAVRARDCRGKEISTRLPLAEVVSVDGEDVTVAAGCFDRSGHWQCTQEPSVCQARDLQVIRITESE